MARAGREPHIALAALHSGVRSDDDVLDDYAAEVAQLHGLPEDEARRRFRRFLDVYHYGRDRGTEEEWGAIHGGEVEHSFIRISKPFRFRHDRVVAQVVDAIRSQLRSGSEHPRVLDFGGGFGNDAIVFARSGWEAHYCDLLALKNSDVVRRRFELRGLDIPMHDTHALPPLSFDAVSAVDVLEHIYDVEAATAELVMRIPAGGLLCVANAFDVITYDGDHHDKNRVYAELFPKLMAALGFELVIDHPPLEVFRATRQPGDVDAVKRALYETTRDHCVARCQALMAVAGSGSVDWGSLPGPRVLGTGRDAVSARNQARALAARMAPRFVKDAVAKRRARELRGRLGTPSDPAQALASLADHVAVLRIAEHRLGVLDRR
jgi:SAM-dependent methyltransferase